jgi:hypothetical protein
MEEAPMKDRGRRKCTVIGVPLGFPWRDTVSTSPKGGSEKGDPTNRALEGRFKVTFEPLRRVVALVSRFPNPPFGGC